MLDDVIGAATRTGRPVLVVTDARSVALRARSQGARATVTPARGTRDGAAHGVRLAARYGAAAALVVAGDLPFATAADLRRVIAAGGPALLFKHVRGSPFPVVTNLFGTKRRVELAFGREPERFLRDLVRLTETLVPPTVGKLWGVPV